MSPSKQNLLIGNLDHAKPALGIAIVYLASSLPGFGLLFLLFSVIFYLYWTVKKKDDLALIILLLGSSYSYTSSNIWNNGIVPGLPILLLVLSLLLVEVRFKYTGAVVVLSYILLLLAIGVANIFSNGIYPFIVDMMVLVSIPLAALRFNRLTEQQFIAAFSVSTFIFLIKVIVFAFMGIENPNLSVNNAAVFLDTFDELIGFYLVFTAFLLLGPNRLRVITVSLLFVWLLHILGTDNWIGYYGLGSQSLLCLAIFILFALIRIRYGWIIVLSSLFVVALNLPLLTIDTDDLKLKQLISVLDILGGNDIHLLPHSLHVRMAELGAFNDGSLWQKIFGRGFGGYINITSHFPSYLGLDDYSEKQLITAKLTSPHNLGYLMIKFGYVGLILALVLLVMIYRSMIRRNIMSFATYMTFGVFLILNLGYTFKLSVVLGVLWVVVSDCYQRAKTTS